MAQPTQPFTAQVPGQTTFNPPATTPEYQAFLDWQSQQKKPADSAMANPHADPYAPKQWGQLQDFTCPSGQRCALRPLDLNELLQLGLLEKLNMLTGTTEEVVRTAQGQPPVNVQKILEDPKQVVTLMEVIDKTLVTVVAKPALLSATDENGKIPFDKRVPGAVYVDSVGVADRMAIFQHVMRGVEEMQPFREGPSEPGRSVASQPGNALSA